MNPTEASTPSLSRRMLKWPGRLLGPALIVIAGLVMGQQYVAPNKRVLPILIGILITGLAWRVGIVAGLGVLVMTLPYPRGTVFGNTNLALILVLLVIWLLRITQRMSPPPRRTTVDLPIVGLLIMYMLSFNNVRDQTLLIRGVQNLELFLGAVLMFYLIVNNLQSSKDLERLHNFMLISAVSVFALAVYELNHPAAMFIQGWIDFSNTVGSEFNTRNVRVGSAFHDYELLSEYCAVTLLLASFRLLRARSGTGKLLYGSFLVLNAFVLFTTVTRGAIIALALGLIYMLWMVRRHLRFVPFTIVTVAALTGFLAMNNFVARFTRSGDMFARLFQTRVVHGWMPDDRAGSWQNAWGRAMVHPLMGSGPSYGDVKGWELWWPHNVYLYYADIIGFTGLLFFLWLLFKLFRLTQPQTDDLTHPNYAKAAVLVCRAQLVIFTVNEFKIDYLRNNIYLFPVWAMFATWTATALIARRSAAAAPAPVDLPKPASPFPRLRAVGQ